MGISKKKSTRYAGIRKYNKIVRILVKDKKKRGEKYDFRDVQLYASSIYPNFKETPYKSLKIGSVLTATPQELLPSQRNAPKISEIPPFFPPSLINPEDRYYFEVDKLLKDIEAKTSNQIFFTSYVLGSAGLTFQGGTQQPVDFYKKHFQNFITFIDKKRSEKKIDYTDLRIVCTPPVKNPKSKVWESNIIITDSEDNFGDKIDPTILSVLGEFNPEEKYQFTRPTPAKKKQEPPAPTPVSQISSEDKAKIEIEKQKTLQQALEMVKANQMSWEQYDKLLDRLYP